MGAPEPNPAVERLAAALLSAERPILLTGQRLDPEGIGELAQAQSEWGKRADLDRLLTAPGDFWAFFLPVAQAAAARVPGPSHRAIARLQAAGTVDAIITQAVDRLHERAGSHGVVEVYGNVLSARCERCGERYGLDEVTALVDAAADAVPRCTATDCGYPLRPAGTLWNEALPQDAVERAWELAADTDLMVIVDSDLRTAPISLLPSVPLTGGADVILIGAAATRYDRYARQVVRAPVAAPTLCAVADLIAG
ncbi:Sir2 family NAD-dependent protein deacetylase [Mycolicibacterium sp.]|uniref:Sir2 family NAD-dependent protein deacetylase n=1 Tax=Mycolicibacterium sp. TaxID=2320850 RepID=UPI0037C658A5